MSREREITPEEIREAYKAPDNETDEEKNRRLTAKRKAKSRYFAKIRQQSSVSGPSSSTRSQTKRRLPISARTRETNRLRQQRRRASLTTAQKEERKRIERERGKKQYDQKKEKEFEQFYKIGHCSLDDHKVEDIEEEDCRDGRHRLDRINIICRYCLALRWKEEPEGLCCSKGQIQLAQLNPPPEILELLLTEEDPDTNKPFVDQIRAYNQIFAFTSIEGARLDTNLANARKGVYIYKIQGQHYHQHGGLMPEIIEGIEPKPQFAQIYFYDGPDIDTQVNRRYNLMEKTLNYTMLQQLQYEISENNPFAHTFISANEIEEEEETTLVFIAIHNTHGKDMRNYNKPICDEIALLHTDYTSTQQRDIIIKRFDDKLTRISELHGAYDSLQYPLLFLFGEYGWHKGILRANVQQKIGEKEEVKQEEQQEEEKTQQEYNQAESSQQLFSNIGLTKQQVLDDLFDLPISVEKQTVEEQQIVEEQQNVEEEQSIRKSVEKTNPQETTSVDFESLYKERTQSQTGVTDILEDVTLRSSTRLSISEKGEGSKSTKKEIQILEEVTLKSSKR